MALSVFPNGIPIFTDHRDLLDDVKASHINSIQRELTSVAEVMGPNPHVYGDLTSSTQYVQADPGGDGALTAGFIGITQTSSRLNEINYGTVSARLDAMQRGDQTHVFSLVAGGMVLPPTTNLNFSNPLVGVSFPNQGLDPYGLYNGYGITIKKRGWYHVQANVIINLQGNQAQRDGAYAASISFNNYNLLAYDRERLNDSASSRNPGSLVLQPQHNGLFNAGDTMHIRIGHDSAINHTVQSVYMNGYLVREM